MPRYEKDLDGGGKTVIETSVPREGVRLLADGYRVSIARTEVVREADAESDSLDPVLKPFKGSPPKDN